MHNENSEKQLQIDVKKCTLYVVVYRCTEHTGEKRMKEYIAHKTENEVQTVKEHLEGTPNLSASFAAAFGAEELGRLCGLAHDIGKYSEGFQLRIMEDGPKVDHASAGAIECCERKQDIAAMCVMGHHGGLMNLGGRDDLADADSFCGRMNRYKGSKRYAYDAWKQEVKLPSVDAPSVEWKHWAFYTRMLYSCLVDADFLDTAAFMGEKRDHVVAKWNELNHRLDEYTCGWYPPKGELNRIRCAILDTCRSQGETGEGSLFTLTVPTGGGKTVSSLAFALRHAKAAGKDRVIYVIPYTSIIEQTAAEFRKILGQDVVLEHHSGIVYDDGEGENPDARQKRMKYASENWDMPVVVTTAVQFFESLYDHCPSACRKLHNIANSVVIFDEAQMLPLPYLKPCVYAISELTRAYNVTAILCTATQPALGTLFEKYLNETPREICPHQLREDKIFKRVTFHRSGKLTKHELAEGLNQHPQVLCIVNSRAAAQELYGMLDEEGRYHLSTLMPPAERQKKLKSIRERLKQGLTCRVISTSLIEAGVDVDFPTVYREMAGLDSILQAAGRCNRNGERPREESHVQVFESEWRTPPILDVAIGACQSVWDGTSDPSEESIIHHYFGEYLFLKGEEAQDAKSIMSMMSKSTLPFVDIARAFKLIDSGAVTVYVPTEESRPLIDQYRSGMIDRALMRKLGRYGVTVYPNRLKDLLNAGDVENLGGEVYVLLNEQMYCEETGLSLNVELGKAIIC